MFILHNFPLPRLVEFLWSLEVEGQYFDLEISRTFLCRWDWSTWDWRSGKVLTLSLTENNIHLARLNCSWEGEGGNVTWLVDSHVVQTVQDDKEQSSILQEDQEHSSILDLYWDKLNKTGGDIVTVTCRREKGSNNNTVMWSSESQSSVLVKVPEDDIDKDNIEEDIIEEDVDIS